MDYVDILLWNVAPGTAPQTAMQRQNVVNMVWKVLKTVHLGSVARSLGELPKLALEKDCADDGLKLLWRDTRLLRYWLSSELFLIIRPSMCGTARASDNA